MRLPVLVPLVGALVLWSATSFALAQTAPAQSPAAISPATLDLARSVVTNAGMARPFDAQIPNMLAQLNNTLTRTRPELSADMKVVIATLTPEFAARTKPVVDDLARLVATTFSEAELKDISAFYASPTGKKWVDSQPVVVQQLMGYMDGWGQKTSQDMLARIREEMKKRGKDL